MLMDTLILLNPLGWFAVPGAPSEINHEGKVNIIVGDILYSSVFPFVRNNEETFPEAWKALETLERNSSNDVLDPTFRSLRRDSYEYQGSLVNQWFYACNTCSARPME